MSVLQQRQYKLNHTKQALLRCYVLWSVFHSTMDPSDMEDTTHWVAEQKKEDIFDEIIYNSKKTNLTHLRRVGWTSFPVSHSFVFPNHDDETAVEKYLCYLLFVHFIHVGRRDSNFSTIHYSIGSSQSTVMAIAFGVFTYSDV